MDSASVLFVKAILFVKAMGFGLAVAAPVGPMAVLCMRRTLVQGWRHGLATGLGIAVGDGLYALVAALGLASVSAFVFAYEKPLHAAAGLFLLYLGVKTFLARGADADAPARPVSGTPRGHFASAVLLTLTNPPTIIMFAAIFAALAPASGFEPSAAALTVGGVMAGSMLWWVLLTAVVMAFRHAIGPRVRRWIDRIAGAALAVFGLAELRRAL
ncbi:LysE family translocator [Pseudoxanthobacter sp.]|uniref:LysE family translocator n=1 Tax=Pseudoxanthobacter sp. TaxID=1925742 RepID=UPI002FE0CD0A